MGVKKEILKGVEAKKKRWTWSICAQRKLKYYSQYYCFSFKNLRKLILFKLFIVQFLLSKRNKSQKEYFLHLLDNLWRCFLRKLRIRKLLGKLSVKHEYGSIYIFCLCWHWKFVRCHSTLGLRIGLVGGDFFFILVKISLVPRALSLFYISLVAGKRTSIRDYRYNR